MTVPTVGETLGVEEEYHVVDADTFALLDSPEFVTHLSSGDAGPRVSAEIATTQIETATGVCRTLADVRAELVTARQEAAAAAARFGGTILAASIHPHASWTEQRLTLKPRYLTLLQRHGLLALQQVICGCHVHVSVPDMDTAVRIMGHARPYLPLLLALTGSSPFHEGIDTGYDSYRTQWFARWPMAGPPEPMEDGAEFFDVVNQLAVADVIDDASNLYWDIRPSVRYPTLEFRVADVCTDLDDAVLHAALVRALAVTLAERIERGEQPRFVRQEVLRAARWRAARYGLNEPIFDPTTAEYIEPRLAVARLLLELEPELAKRHESEEVRALAHQLLERGTSATQQRQHLHKSADTSAIAGFLSRVTLRGCDASAVDPPHAAPA